MAHVPQPHEVTAVGILFLTLCTILVALRFYARRLKAMHFGADDGFTVASWVLVSSLCSLIIYNSFHGHLDKSLPELTPPQRTAWLKRLFAEAIMSYSSLAVTKVSIVLFYLRIFVVRSFRRWAYPVLVAITIWWLLAVLTLVFSVGPDPKENWLPTKPPVSDYYPGAQVALGVIDIVLDLYILCLPIPQIKKLHVSRGRKISLLGIFWLGALCVIASVVRLYYSVLRFNAPELVRMPSADFRTIVINLTIWGVIEPACSLIAACLPTLGPLVKEDWNIGENFNNIGSWLTSMLASVTSLLTSKQTTKESQRTGSDSSAPINQRWYPLEAVGGASVVVSATKD